MQFLLPELQTPAEIAQMLRALGVTAAELGIRQQVRDAHVHEPKRGDPTATGDLRKRYSTEVDIRWRRMTAQTRNAVIEQDALGLTDQPGPFGLAALTPDGRLRVFQGWFDQTLDRIVLERDAGYLDRMIEHAYRRGLSRAQKLSRNVEPPAMLDTINHLQQLTLVELQGICEATSQRVVRLGAEAQLTRKKPSELMKLATDAINVVGVTRSRQMISTMVVKTHGVATLDTFEAAGVQQVALVPEHVRPVTVKVHDAAIFPALRRIGKSLRTLQRIAREEGIIGKAFEGMQVEVLTAGDDRVCDECEEIAADGPYSIDEARSLIPAHPNCRCSFIPEGSSLFGVV